MYGHLLLSENRKSWRCALSGEEVHGLALLRAEVSAPESLRPKVLIRRVRRAGERLWAYGVNRVLVSEQFPHALWAPLEQAGLARVETEALCQEQAAALILAALAKRGVEPERAAVCLSGRYAAGAVQRTAQALASRVGRLIIDCPGQGDVLAGWLRQEYGLPLVEPGTIRADLTAAFAPERKGVQAGLRLYGPFPDLGGLVLEPKDWTLPPDFAPLPLLAALRDGGRLTRDGIQARAVEAP